MNCNKIISICVDDIYYLDHSFKMSELFQEKKVDINVFKTIVGLSTDIFLKH